MLGTGILIQCQIMLRTLLENNKNVRIKYIPNKIVMIKVTIPMFLMKLLSIHN